MSQIFSSLARLFQKKYTKMFLIFGGVMLMGVCFGQNNPQYTESDMTKNIIEIFDLIFGLLALILGPMVVLAGWLLSPDWTMGDFFGLRGYFKEVWILVANIVYIIFALMLLYMAIMQIFGGSESEYAFKKKLPSFLVGILLVPFTWLIVSWTLSFANQAVAAVLSIPMGSIGKISKTDVGTQDTSMWHKKMLPTQFDFSSNESGYGNMKCSDGLLQNKDGTTTPCISPAEFLTQNQAGPFFIIMIYAYNIFKIQDADINEIKDFCSAKTDSGNNVKYESAKSCVESLVSILRNFGLSLVVTVFFAVMLIALCWVLLMRAIKLWIYIMLSPLFGLAYFTGKGFSEGVGEAGESGFGQVGFKSFFKLAMVPVLVSAVLAFGLLFVGVVRDNFHGGVKNPGQTVFCTQEGVGYMVTYCIEQTGPTTAPVYNSKLIIGTDTTTDGKSDSRITLNFGDAFSHIIGGAEGDGVISSAGGAVAGGISSVDDVFAHIILTMMALVFMFMGVKVAASYDPVTEAAFKPFASLGESVGNFVAHSPSYLPLPHPAFAALTPAGMKGLSTVLDNSVREHEYAAGKSAADLFDGNLNSFKSSVGNAAASADELNNNMQRVSNEALSRNPKEVASAIKQTLQKINTPEAKQLAEIINDNDKSNKRLGDAIDSHQALVDTVITQAGASKDPLRQMLDKAKQVGEVHSTQASTPRTIDGNIGTITGSGKNHTVTIDGQTLNFNSSFNQTALNQDQNRAITKLKTAITTNNTLDMEKAQRLFPGLPEADLKKYLQIP